MWVKLIFDIIEELVDERGFIADQDEDLKESFDLLPSTVDQAYAKILEKARKNVLAMKLLQIVVSTTRPLTLTETNVALAIKPGFTDLKCLHLVPEKEFHTWSGIAVVFLTILGSKIYLIYQTAKAFLVSNGAATRNADLLAGQAPSSSGV